MPANLYHRGVILVILAGVCLSSAGIIVRSIETADGWQILFYRALCFCLTLALIIFWNHGRKTGRAFRAIGWPGVIAGLCLGAGFAFYLFGLILTTVANLSFMLSASPLIAAALAWILLREKVSSFTLLAMVIAVVGMGIMFADGLETGLWFGNLVALGAPLTFAIMLVLYRMRADCDMTPATFLGGLVSLMIAIVMADGLIIGLRDTVLACVMGFFQIGLGFTLITIGARWVPAAQVALLSLSETILAPIWVWVFIGEVPNETALLGGMIILIAVAGQGIYGLKRGV